MEVFISLAKAGSDERWDEIPETRFDNAKEGKALVAQGKKKRRRIKLKSGLIDTPLSGAEKRQMDIQDTVRCP
jgi:hypothetical protein|uniref:Uncharacterized protein n=1 Tax=Myoviridae sp. ctshb19 TaxID=2825194 RepID=A0A8S5UGX0_9CAUD|nr:MAG TPA: hypothetical protein [Myoviridae sp. ctshb19]